jgi:hypothetical protein
MSPETSHISAITRTGYSADVRIDLSINGRSFPVAQIGGGRIFFDHPTLLPSGMAEIILHVDEHKSRWRVALPPMKEPAQVIRAEFVPLDCAS